MKAKKKLILIFTGLFAGVDSAMLGIGGGAVVVPFLAIFLNTPLKQAIGTSLSVIVPTTLVGIITHYLIDPTNIIFKVVAFVVLGSIIGSKLGVVITKKLNEDALRILLGMLLVISALKLLNVIIFNFSSPGVSGNIIYMLLLGIIGGVISSMFGIGGGVIMVPILHFMFGLTILQSIATSLTIILPTALAGLFFHRKEKQVNPVLVKFLLPSALVGAVAGAYIANLLPLDVLTVLFGLMLLLFAASFLFKSKNYMVGWVRYMTRRIMKYYR